MVIQTFKLNKNSFSKEVGIDNNVTIGRIVNENRSPSFEVLNKILSRFPEINADWLLTGKGSMFRNGSDDMDDRPDPLASCRSEVDRLHGLLSEKDRQIASLLEQQEKLIGKLTE